MTDSFNERIFDDTITEITKSLKVIKKTGIKKLNMNDVENAIDGLLNDDAVLRKIPRNDIIKYTTLLKHEINKNNFGLGYLKSRVKIIKEQNNMFSFVREKKNKKSNPFRKLNFDIFFKTFSSSILNLSKDLILLFFTICIVAHLRIRTFINSCYLYPSNPNRFPYVFYNKEKKEQKQILSIENTQVESEVDPAFEDVRIFYKNDGTPSHEKNIKMNDMCGGNNDGVTDEKDLLETATKLLFGENDESDKEKLSSSIEKIIQELHGSNFADKLERINISSKTFMEEHYEKCSEELSIYSLVTYMMYFNTIKNRESIGYLHNSLFKYLTSSGSSAHFGVISILFYSLFKNNVRISEKFVNNVLDNYKERYKSGGKIHHIFTALLSCVLAPFVTFSLMLMIIMYPLSLYNCLKSYFNYVDLTNMLSTKLVCYIGMFYSVFALAFYVFGMVSAIFPEFFAYMANELKYNFGGGGGGGGGSGKSDEQKAAKKSKKAAKKAAKKAKKSAKKAAKTNKMKDKVVKLEESKDYRENKKNEQKEKLKTMKKGKAGSKTRKKYDEQQSRVRRNRKRVERKDKKIKNKNRKIGKREGFSGEKGCSNSGFFSGFFKDFNVAKLFGLVLLSILGIFVFMPVVMPFICAFMSSFGIASSLSFDALKFMSSNLCSIKDYSSIIKLLVSLVIIHQIINHYSYSPKRKKWITICIYLAVLVIYLGVESFSKPTEKYLKESCENSN